jgi:hypothetical protein
MKFLKIIGLIVLVIIILILCIGAFLPPSKHIQVSRIVPADPVSCFTQVANLRNWEAWAPWKEMDPDIELEYFQSSANTDTAFSWNGPLSGRGAVSVSERIPFSGLSLQVILAGRYKALAGFNFKPVEGGTLITCQVILDDLSYPVGRWMGLVTPSMLTPSLHKSLENIELTLTR